LIARYLEHHGAHPDASRYDDDSETPISDAVFGRHTRKRQLYRAKLILDAFHARVRALHILVQPVGDQIRGADVPPPPPVFNPSSSECVRSRSFFPLKFGQTPGQKFNADLSRARLSRGGVPADRATA
jgi:hypothetical protein